MGRLGPYEVDSIIVGDCLEIMRNMPDGCVDAVITDPPYGISLQTNYGSRGRGCLARSNDYSPIVGDDVPFDPLPFLRFPTVALFGANYFCNKLPISGGWIVWDKLDGLQSKRNYGFNDNSDCELIWTNKGNAARIIRHRWMGCMKGSEHTERRLHPTQKPIAIMVALIEYLTKSGDIVFDPFIGSGTTAVAAKKLGRHYFGCDINSDYVRMANERVAKVQGVQLELL